MRSIERFAGVSGNLTREEAKMLANLDIKPTPQPFAHWREHLFIGVCLIVILVCFAVLVLMLPVYPQ